MGVGVIVSAHKEESPQDFPLGYSGNQLWVVNPKGGGWVGEESLKLGAELGESQGSRVSEGLERDLAPFSSQN